MEVRKILDLRSLIEEMDQRPPASGSSAVVGQSKYGQSRYLLHITD